MQADSGTRVPQGGTPRVLLIDDSELNRELLRRRFENVGVLVETAADGESGWARFQQQPFEIVVTGLGTSSLDGIGLTRRIRSAASRNATVPVLLVTAVGTFSSAVAAGRAGVTDGFPLNEAGLRSLVARALDLLDSEKPQVPYVLLGSSMGISGVRERLRGVAPLCTPVLISGEQGSGHAEAVAYLHALSGETVLQLHRVDCTASPSIGWVPDRGLWHLEEVQELSRDAQLMCKRWISERQAANDGGEVRLIASTTKDLNSLASRMLFLPDLARDLCQFEIRLPPLRERRDDLPKLISAILEVVGDRIGRPGLGISGRAVDLLCGRAWWGNLVELASVLESLAAFSSGLEITEAQAELVLVDSDPIVRAARERAQIEREQLLRLMKDCRGNITHMAERLKVDRGTIRYRLRKYGLHSSVSKKFRDL